MPMYHCEREKMGEGSKAMTIVVSITKEAHGGVYREDKNVPEHLKTLRIPPAWTNVTVNPDPKASCYAMGLDSKMRVCRLYAPHHTKAASQAKFDKTHLLFKQAARIEAKLVKAVHKQTCNDTEIVAYLIFEMGLRPGSLTDTKADKQAYGAITLQARHVKVMASGTVYLHFTGKKGVTIHQKVKNPFLQRCLYAKKLSADGRYTARLFDTNPGKLNAYIKSICEGCNPKDFRTLKSTQIATNFMEGKRIPKTKAKAKLMLRKLFIAVSCVLGNTPAVCRKSYVCPTIYEPLTQVIGDKPVKIQE